MRLKSANHQSNQATAHSAERRSAADLQRILDAMIGSSGFVLAGDLPDGMSNSAFPIND